MFTSGRTASDDTLGNPAAGAHPVVRGPEEALRLQPTVAVIPFSVQDEAHAAVGDLVADAIDAQLCLTAELRVITAGTDFHVRPLPTKKKNVTDHDRSIFNPLLGQAGPLAQAVPGQVLFIRSVVCYFTKS